MARSLGPTVCTCTAGCQMKYAILQDNVRVIAQGYQSAQIASEELRRRCTSLEEENRDLHRRLILLEREREEIKVIRLEELAVQFPDFPALFAMAEKIRLESAKRERRRALGEIRKLFPLRSDFYNKPAWYDPQFSFLLEEKYADQEQELLAKGIELLCDYGADHRSLYVKKAKAGFPGSPEGCWIARASGVLRFTFTVGQEALCIHSVYRRGDTRYNQY